MDATHEDSIYPGPQDPSLLTEQSTHISEQLWRGQERDTENHILRIRRNESMYWSIYQDPAMYGHDLVRAGIRGSCLAGVSSIGHMHLDHSLITGIIERWRRETHTFHLTCGEATITLQDVQVQLGLPTVGRLVVLSQRRWGVDEWAALISRLFGIPRGVILPHIISRSFLRASFLLQHFRNLAPETPDEIDHHIRFHLLYLLHMLFGDASGNKIKMELMIFLEDYHSLGEYSWGGAVLAYLYRSLCTGALSSTVTIGGPLMLLQMWTWERIRILSPVIVRPSTQHGSVRGRYWALTASHLDVSRHTLRTYRDELDHMPMEAFLWEPYSAILDSLPGICLEGSELWRVRCPLIFLWVVEWHYGDRVLRQFGMQQPIPWSPESRHRRLHACGGKGRENTDWADFHASEIAAWTNRVPIHPVQYAEVHEYMTWYRSVTRLYMVNPSQNPPQTGYHGSLGRIGYLVDSFSHVLHMSRNTREQELTDTEELRELREFRDYAAMIATNAITSVGAEDLLRVPPRAPTRQTRTRRTQEPEAGQSTSTSTRRRRGPSTSYHISSPDSNAYRPNMDFTYHTPQYDTHMEGTSHDFDYQSPATLMGAFGAGSFDAGSFGTVSGSYGMGFSQGSPISQTQTFTAPNIDDTQEEEDQQEFVRRGPHRAARDRIPPCGTQEEHHHHHRHR